MLKLLGPPLGSDVRRTPVSRPRSAGLEAAKAAGEAARAAAEAALAAAQVIAASTSRPSSAVLEQQEQGAREAVCEAQRPAPASLLEDFITSLVDEESEMKLRSLSEGPLWPREPHAAADAALGDSREAYLRLFIFSLTPLKSFKSLYEEISIDSIDHLEVHRWQTAEEQAVREAAPVKALWLAFSACLMWPLRSLEDFLQSLRAATESFDAAVSPAPSPPRVTPSRRQTPKKLPTGGEPQVNQEISVLIVLSYYIILYYIIYYYVVLYGII